MASPTEIVSANIRTLLANDPRSESEIGRVADALYPGRQGGAASWRKAILRARESGWPAPDVAQAIADVFGLPLHALYVERSARRVRGRGNRTARGR